jgi:hypothetical protein
MTKAQATATPLSRPNLVDFLLVLAGASLSLYLMQLGPLRAEAPTDVEVRLRLFVAFLPGPLRLCEGIVLLWPLFFSLQRLLGRAQGLTGGEWLWVFSWLGVALLTGLSAWDTLGELPSFLQPHAIRPRIFWYMVFVPVMAVVAVVLALLGLLSRTPRPWTHSFSLALMIWPALPLAAILALGRLL